MSSDPTTPYKSRFLNFLNRQSLRLGDQFQRTFRHVKVAVSWGVQIALYPIYAVVQTSRLAGRQVGQAVAHSQFLFEATTTPPQVDEPIEQVLKIAETWLQNSQQLQSSSVTIQGIASQIQERQIVLVGANNQIFAILTPSQQHQLQRKISWEIANYRRQQHLIQAQKVANRLPISIAKNPHVLPPVRLFWRVMDWIQTSPIASSINLFGESAWNYQGVSPQLPSQRLSPGSQLQKSLSATPVLSVLDRAAALLDKKQLNTSKITSLLAQAKQKLRLKPPIHVNLDDNSANLPSQLQNLIKGAIDYFFNQPSPPSLLGNKKQLSTATPQGLLPGQTKPDQEIHSVDASSSLTVPLVSNDSTLIQSFGNKLQHLKAQLQQQKDFNLFDPKDPFSFRLLLQAAIDYFFAHKQSPSLPLNGTQNSALPQAEVPPAEDPWLSWQDLYGEQGEVAFTPTEPESGELKANSTPPKLKGSTPLPQAPIKSVLESIKANLKIKRNPQAKISSSLDDTKQLSDALPQAKTPSVEDPWLSRYNFVEEQAAEPESGEIKANSTPPKLKGSTPLPQAPIKSVFESIKANLKIKRNPQDSPLTTTKTDQIANYKFQKGEISTSQSRKGEFTQVESSQQSYSPRIYTRENQVPQTSPDWIETNATPNGYVKHPLVRILEWLDSAILWLEETAVQIWQWLRRHIG